MTIEERLQHHYEKLLDHFPENEIVGIFCYGSQNYNFDHEGSDLDTKAIVIPSFRGLCLEKPISLELDMGNGEHCEVKDLREMVKMFKKQNINFLEILYTPYRIINPIFNELWKISFDRHREEIVHMNPYAGVLSICGQAKHTLKQNVGNGKKYANAMRLKYYLENYINGKSFVYCITLPSGEFRDKLMAFKIGADDVPESSVKELISQFDAIQASVDKDELEARLKPTMMNMDEYLEETIMSFMIFAYSNL